MSELNNKTAPSLFEVLDNGKGDSLYRILYIEFTHLK